MSQLLLEKALALVLVEHRASESFLERRLKIGHETAGRIVEVLEAAGIARWREREAAFGAGAR